MVTRLVLLLAILAAPLGAQDLVPRVLGVEWRGPESDPTFLTEVLRAALSQEPTYLVADAGDIPDARLVVTAQGKGQVVATFTDPHDPNHSWSKTLEVAPFGAASLRTVASALRPTLAASLPPVPPQVREELVNKTVQEVKIDEKQKGLRVALMGLPGTELRFAGGPSLTIPDSGSLVLEDQVQFSSLAVTARLPGYFDRTAEVALGASDLEYDLTLKPAPEWAVAASWALSIHLDAQKRLGPGPWFLQGSLETSWPVNIYGGTVTLSDTNALNLPLGELPKVSWVQLGAGAVWYGSRPEEGFVWGFEGEALARVDFYPSGPELSRWYPVGLRAGALGGLRMAPWVSLDLRFELGAHLTPRDTALVDNYRADGFRPDIELLGYRYQDSGNDDLYRISGVLALRSTGGLELRFWF